MPSAKPSPRSSLLGHQEPRVLVGPDLADAFTDRAEATIQLAAAYGLDLDPWQQHFVLRTLAERKDGMWLSPQSVQSVPRQNGKNGGIEAIELGALLLFGERLIVHSAHEVKTALEAFRRIRDYFDNYDDLRKQVKAIRTTNGDEGIELLTGQRLRFMARSKNSGRGFSVPRLILDEAQELSAATYAAVLPAMAAQTNPQVILTGTPPPPTGNGEVFALMRSNALSGKGGSMLYSEHSADPELDYDDRLGWEQANPALGIRISEETVEGERASLTDDAFARERLGIWDSVAKAGVIPLDTWATLASDRPTLDAEIALSVDVSPDRSTASVGLAGWRDDSKPQVEVIDIRKGVGWVVDYVAGVYERRQVRAVVIDSVGPAASLIEPLRARGVLVTTTSASQVAQACGAFYDAAMEDTLRHLDQPQLTTALAAARKRSLGDAWAWHRKDSTDITPLVAVTLALWGLTATGVAAKPKKKVARVSHAMYGFN